MNVARSKFIVRAGAFTLPAIVRYPAGAAEFSYKLAFTYPIEGYPPPMRAAAAADKINLESGGRMQIKVFPNSQLGGATDILGQLRLGAVEITLTPNSDTATIAPTIGMTALPFIVSNHKVGVELFSGALGAYVHNTLAKVGVFQLRGSWDSDFQQVENSLRPVVVPADLRGMKLRSTPSPPEIAVLKALGATPSPITSAEVYTAIQTHLVDGATFPVENFLQHKIYEITKYVSLTNHSWLGTSVLMNAAAWQRLPKNLQDLVARNFEAARNLSNADMEASDASSIDLCKQHGMMVNAVDTQAFRKAIAEAGLYTQWKTTYPTEAWALLEKMVGKLG